MKSAKNIPFRLQEVIAQSLLCWDCSLKITLLNNWFRFVGQFIQWHWWWYPTKNITSVLLFVVEDSDRIHGQQPTTYNMHVANKNGRFCWFLVPSCHPLQMGRETSSPCWAISLTNGVHINMIGKDANSMTTWNKTCWLSWQRQHDLMGKDIKTVVWK